MAPERPKWPSSRQTAEPPVKSSKKSHRFFPWSSASWRSFKAKKKHTNTEPGLDPTASTQSTALLTPEQPWATGLDGTCDSTLDVTQSIEDSDQPTDLWDQAYQKLQQNKPGLIREYEKLLLQEGLHDNKQKLAVLEDLNQHAGFARSEQLTHVLQRQRDLYAEGQWKVKVGRRELPVQDLIQKVVGAIITAKSFLDAAASNEPHAALAWAGVSVILSVLLKSVQQETAAIEGLSSVGKILLRYRVLQKIYLDDHQRVIKMQPVVQELWKAWRLNTIDLYCEILGYQFRLADHYCHSGSKRVARNMFSGNEDWETLLLTIKQLAKDGEDHENTLRAVDGQRLDRIHADIESQDATMNLILNEIREDRWERRSQEIGRWLGDMFESKDDQMHAELRGKRLSDDLPYLSDVRSWLADGNEQTLWTTAPPGMGKSMALSATIDFVERRLLELRIDGVAFVFFQWERQSDQTPAAVTARILHQLRTRSAWLAEVLGKLFDSTVNRSKPSANDLRSVLEGPHSLRSGEDGLTLLVFDALDEARPEVRGMIELWAERLQSSRFRILVSSRHSPSNFTRQSLIRQRNLSTPQGELLAYVHQTLQQSRTSLQVRHEERNRIAANIVSRSQGLFMAVSMNTKRVLSAGNSIRKMLTASESGLEGLSDLYEDAIKQMGDAKSYNEDVQTILSWLTYAKRPLTCKELSVALSYNRMEAMFEADDLPNVFEITNLCRGLVSIDHQTQVIRLPHQTIREYLQSRADIQALRPGILAACIKVANDTQVVEVADGRRCAPTEGEFASVNVYGGMFAEEPAWDTFMADWSGHEHEFRSYALEFWMAHLRDAEPDDADNAEAAFLIYQAASPTKWVKLMQAATGIEGSALSSHLETLTLASFNGHGGILSRFLETRLFGGSHVGTAIYWAAQQGHIECLRILEPYMTVEAYSSSCQDGYGSPLLAGATGGHDDCVNFLLTKDFVSVNERDLWGLSALSLALKNRRFDTAVTILSWQPFGTIDFNMQDLYTWTPLFWAVDANSIEIVATLVSNTEVDVNATDKKGRSVLSVACELGYAEMVKTIVSRTHTSLRSDDRDAAGLSPFMYAVKSGSLATVEAMMEYFSQTPQSEAGRAKQELIAQDHEGRNVFAWAAQSRDTEILQLLLAKDPTGAQHYDRSGWLPITWALEPPGYPSAAELLMVHSKQFLNHLDHSGRSLLSLAVIWRIVEIVHLFLSEPGVDVNSRDEAGRTALSHCAEKGPLETLLLLLGCSEIDVDLPDHKGQTPLYFAAMNGNGEMTDILIKTGRADPAKVERFNELQAQRKPDTSGWEYLASAEDGY